MFNHDIEVNFNLNRMGVAWFQQHSPQTISHRSQNNEINNLSGVEKSSANGLGLNYHPMITHMPANPPKTPYMHNVREHIAQFSNSMIDGEIQKTPLKICQSKRLRDIPGSLHKSRVEEPLELVDVIDLEDEDNSISAFFVGMNNIGIPSQSKPNSSQQKGENKISNNLHITSNSLHKPFLFLPRTKYSVPSDSSKTQQHNELPGRTFSNNSVNSYQGTTSIIKAVTTVNISNKEEQQHLVP